MLAALASSSYTYLVCRMQGICLLGKFSHSFFFLTRLFSTEVCFWKTPSTDCCQKHKVQWDSLNLKHTLSGNALHVVRKPNLNLLAKLSAKSRSLFLVHTVHKANGIEYRVSLEHHPVQQEKTEGHRSEITRPSSNTKWQSRNFKPSFVIQQGPSYYVGVFTFFQQVDQLYNCY